MADKSPRLAEFMPYRLSIASNAVSDLIAREYQNRFGLKIAEWRVMAILGDVGSATQRELVTATRMDKVAVSRSVKALAARALIKRNPNAADGRSQYLQLSKTGHELYDEIMPHAVDMEKRLLSALTNGEQRALADLLDRLMVQADEIAEP
ncbi:MarR family winged helix-turn-helix transcriptional regulator [Sphingorhabdus sp. Alg239-R122]|uniref:MarR family winged helix-turn-helix transcriptional regulator n=1 Tax=Sphingorhabdus sp. Alg239-R122 TaxID=2305989 RepID=UPI0013DAB940|nr:MarR family winged helix-turn-helix transcriptional regulator [Sphingorhabdus sp. Alg239-R122]